MATFAPIPVSEFLERTAIDVSRDLEHSWESARQVVSMRQLVSIEAVQIMHGEYLKKLFDHTTIASGNKERVYEGCKIHLITVSPHAVRIGQRFIERRKYMAILEQVGSILEKFTIPSGITNLPALILYGKTADGTPSIAHYVPPIVEMNGDAKWTLLDGVHRNFLIQGTGGVTPIIAVEGVKIPFPCSLHEWSVIRPVDEKPPIEERYFDLRPELFRELKYVGIDG